VQANWKLIIENTLECYHCGPMHPELCELIPLYRTGKVFADEDFSAGVLLGEQVEAFTITGKASRPPLPEDTRRYCGLLFLPNMFINLLSDHVVVDTFQPQGPERTLVISDWLFDPDVMVRSDFDPSDAVDLLDLVNRQDWVVCELTQKRHGLACLSQRRQLRARRTSHSRLCRVCIGEVGALKNHSPDKSAGEWESSGHLTK
jgi:Rieske 2Fe-2S family protein